MHDLNSNKCVRSYQYYFISLFGGYPNRFTYAR